MNNEESGMNLCLLCYICNLIIKIGSVCFLKFFVGCLNVIILSEV